MDALDVDVNFGDESVPEVGVNGSPERSLGILWAMAASAAVLRYLKQSGPELQEQLTPRPAIRARSQRLLSTSWRPG